MPEAAATARSQSSQFCALPVEERARRMLMQKPHMSKLAISALHDRVQHHADSNGGHARGSTGGVQRTEREQLAEDQLEQSKRRYMTKEFSRRVGLQKESMSTLTTICPAADIGLFAQSGVSTVRHLHVTGNLGDHFTSAQRTDLLSIVSGYLIKPELRHAMSQAM